MSIKSDFWRVVGKRRVILVVTSSEMGIPGKESLAADQIWRYRRSFAIADPEQIMRMREAELNKT